MMKIGIIDSTYNSYVDVPDIEETIFHNKASVQLYQVSSTDELPDEIYDVDGLISWHLVPLSDRFMSNLRHCKGIARAAVGFDNIDIASARRNNIPVANIPDYGTEEVADHTLAIALSLLRRIPRGHQVVTGGSWDWREVGPVPRLRGFKVGIVGFGRIGTAVALRFKSFGCDVFFHDPYVGSGVEKSIGVTRCESLQALLDTADLVSLHLPLNDETNRILGARELEQLRDKYLINTARGGLIDGAALCRALTSGSFFKGVGLDVYEDEKSAVPDAFQHRSDVILSPHVAFYSSSALPELRRKSATVLLDLIETGGHRNTTFSSPPFHR